MNLSDLIIKEQEVDMGQRPQPGQEDNPVPSGEKTLVVNIEWL